MIISSKLLLFENKQQQNINVIIVAHLCRLGKNMSHYQSVIVEIVILGGEKRVRPISGQVYPSTMYVECSKRMRSMYPAGTQIKLFAKQTCKQGGNPFLYCHYNSNYTVVN